MSGGSGSGGVRAGSEPQVGGRKWVLRRTLALSAVSVGLVFGSGCSAGESSTGTGPTGVSGSDLVLDVARPETDPKPRDGNNPATVVSDWMDLHLDLVRRQAVSAPVATRIFANAAVATAVAAALATDDQPLAIDGIAYPPAPSGVSLNAAVVASSAAAEASRALFPNADARESVDALEAHHYRTFAGDDESVLLGRRVADAVMARAASDGYDTIERRRPPITARPGTWEPTPPAFRRAREPGWGNLLPFIASDDDCPVGDPVPYSEDPDSPFFDQAMAVYNIAEALTDDQRDTARYWKDRPSFTSTPSGHWIHIGRTELDRDLDERPRETSLAVAAELYALLAIAQADTFIANWKVKYRTDVVRPVTYLQKLIDPDWLPVLNTPAFPEYPSGHSAGSAASASILARTFGDRGFTDTTHAVLGWPDRTYSSFTEAAMEASQSRLYGGIHFPMGLSAGEQQGRCIANVALDRIGS